MSLNEIYDTQINPSVKSWQNYRFNNLNIMDKFNIDSTGADPGDVLQLDSGLNYTWEPFSNTSSTAIVHAQAVFTLSNLAYGTNPVVIPFTSLPITNAAFTISSGTILVNTTCSLLLFLNITSIPLSTALPIFQLSKIPVTNPNSPILLINMSPYRTQLTSNIPNTSCNALTPIQCVAGDKIQLKGVLAVNSTTNCTIIPFQSDLGIMRIA